MSALQRLFNYELNQSSPCMEETVRVVHRDEDGNEFVSFEKFDSAKFQRSQGFVSDWSLESLLKAGVNPQFPIHTSNPTVMEGVSSIRDWSAAADSILSSEITETPETSES